MFTKHKSAQIYTHLQLHSCLMPFGLVFPSFPALVLTIGLFGKIMAARTGTNVDNNAGRGYFDPRFKRCFGT
jgi:hypothetical protein